MRLFDDEELIPDGKTVELLKDRFMEVPTTVLNTQSGNWVSRKKRWIKLGVKGHIGRVDGMQTRAKDFSRLNKISYTSQAFKKINENQGYASVFNPALAELMYNWFCPNNGTVLDPFCGGITRGAVAAYMNLSYLGIDIRKEQINSNYELYAKMDGSDLITHHPSWVLADSNVYLDAIEDELFDMMLTCPPYGDLEVYSDMDGDLSNMKLEKFNDVLSDILIKASRKVKHEGYIVIVAGDYRNKRGYLVDFLGTIKKAMIKSGWMLYNEIILITPIGNKAMTANILMKNKKMIKTHENVLCFKKY